MLIRPRQIPFFDSAGQSEDPLAIQLLRSIAALFRASADLRLRREMPRQRDLDLGAHTRRDLGLHPAPPPTHCTDDPHFWFR